MNAQKCDNRCCKCDPTSYVDINHPLQANNIEVRTISASSTPSVHKAWSHLLKERLLAVTTFAW